MCERLCYRIRQAEPKKKEGAKLTNHGQEVKGPRAPVRVRDGDPVLGRRVDVEVPVDHGPRVPDGGRLIAVIVPVAGTGGGHGRQRLRDARDHAGALLLGVRRLQAQDVVLVPVRGPEVQREEARVVAAGLRRHVDGARFPAGEDADGEAVEVEDAVVDAAAIISRIYLASGLREGRRWKE
jgi:hypothetical protein